MSSKFSKLRFRKILKEESPGRISLGLLIFVVFVASLIPAAFLGWKELYTEFLEKNPPKITVVEAPKGVGLAPTRMSIRFADDNSGIDEVIVRTIQGRTEREMVRKKFGGQQTAKITIEFDGKSSGLEEGEALLEIRAFDRSIWSNAGEQTFRLAIDYRRPSLEVVTTQHNARQGGSQLVFYKVFEKNLAASGVKVGERTFWGFPARTMDQDFEDPSLFACMYAIPLGDTVAEEDVRVFAEDKVGNATSLASPKFYNKIAERRIRHLDVTLNESFVEQRVAQLADKALPALNEIAHQIGDKVEYQTPANTQERLVEQFRLVNENLRNVNDREIQKMLSTNRFDRKWNDAFIPQEGTIVGSFGDLLTFNLFGKPVGDYLRLGFVYGGSSRQDVVAAAAGIVAFSEDLGVFGKSVGIDHGLGIASVYSNLDSLSVSRGDEVIVGQSIGTFGSTGFAPQSQAHFEVRVQGVPVDPTEWLSRTWFHAHIRQKVDDVKRTLGIPVYRSF